MQNDDVAQFIEQESFINYCTDRNDQDVRYWKNWLAQHPEHRQQVEKMRQLILLTFEEVRIREVNKSYTELQHRINARAVKNPSVRRLWPFTIAAASIVVLITVGIYHYFRSDDKLVVATVKPGRFKNDVAAGNKAILTLSDGKQLHVEDLPKQSVLAENIRKNSEGTLVYNKASKVVNAYNTFTVPNGGGKHQLILADGTLAILDAGSSLRFPVAFNGKERRLAATGQVYFEVVHNPKQPFYVEVKGQTIEDIGTRFNVNSFDGVTKTTLLEGSVKVNQVVLKPGQQATQTASGQFNVSSGIDEESVVAWKNGFFKFQNTTLNSVMQQLARWYDLEVVYVGGHKDYHFGGYLSRDSKLITNLKILELNGVKFSLEGNKLTVYKN